jgi:hypothetical protein
MLGNHIKSKKIKRTSKEIKGSPDQRPPRKGVWLLRPALGHPGYAPSYAAAVSRRLFKGIQRKSKEIKRN